MRHFSTITLLLAIALPLPTQAQGFNDLWDEVHHRLTTSVATIGKALGNNPTEGCQHNGTEYRIDWLAFAQKERGPSGVPHHVGSRDTTGNAGPILALSYGGLTRRFTFDRPETIEIPGLPLGALEVGIDLQAYGEVVEVHLTPEAPIDRLTFVFDDLGTTYSAIASVTDGIWVEGITPDGRRIAPAYLYPTLPRDTSNSLVKRRARYERFGAPWAWGTQGDPTPPPLSTTFLEPVVDVVLRITGKPAEQRGWAESSYGVNPPPQSFLISSGAFCLHPNTTSGHANRHPLSTTIMTHDTRP